MDALGNFSAGAGRPSGSLETAGAADMREYWFRPNYGRYIENHAAQTPDSTAFSDLAQQCSWRELQIAVNLCARELQQFGVDPGDVVIVRGANSVDLVLLILSVQACGGIVCPVQDRSTTAELKFVLSHTGAKLCLQTTAGSTEQEAREITGFVGEYVAAEGVRTSFGFVSVDLATKSIPAWKFDWMSRYHFDAMMATSDGASASFAPWSLTTPEDPCRLLFTSGSTGDPKGVLHSYGSTVYATEISAEAHAWTRDAVAWIALPVPLNWGLFQMYSVIISGAHGILRRRFDAEELLASVEGGGVTHIGLPPTGLMKLLERVERESVPRQSSLRVIVSAGAPCSQEVLRKYVDFFNVPVLEAYGMTECGWVSTTTASDASSVGQGTVGQPTRGTRVRVKAENGDLVGPGISGGIEVKGPNLFQGYFRNDRGTKAAFTEDGWFKTGDRGFLDGGGRLTLVGRDKEVIKRGGYLITPREIEEVLLESPLIEEAAVVGIDDPYYGQRVASVVVPANRAVQLSMDAVIEIVEHRLPKYKWPEIVVSLDELPHTPTGKVKRKALQEIASSVARSSSVPASHAYNRTVSTSTSKDMGDTQ
jgi:acyl-CoA synthetase (AMP-forming)/AMP-acid ligase II